jgi:hypothetical protein
MPFDRQLSTVVGIFVLALVLLHSVFVIIPAYQYHFQQYSEQEIYALREPDGQPAPGLWLWAFLVSLRTQAVFVPLALVLCIVVAARWRAIPRIEGLFWLPLVIVGTAIVSAQPAPIASY